jgi:hypothetical protein
MMVEETSYGVVNPTPVKGTSLFYARLPDSNSFSMVLDPVYDTIAYGGGLAVDADFQSDHAEARGTLSTYLYPSQTLFLLGWGLTRVDAGQTLPWVTTNLPNDLASISIYHGFVTADGVWKRRHWTGCKCLSFKLDINRGAPMMKFSAEVQAQKPIGNAYDSSTDPTATEFPFPAETDFPLGPWLFGQSAGLFTLNTAVRVSYESLSIAVTNVHDPRFFEGHFLQSCTCHGRKATLDAALRLKNVPDDRAAYEALTAMGCSVGFTAASHTLTLQFNAQNRIGKLPRDLPLGKEFMQNLSLMNLWDPAAPGDVGFTYT